MKVKDDSVNIWGLQPEMQPVLKWADHVWEHSNERFYAQLEHDEVPKWRQILYKAGVEAWAMIKG